MIKILLIQMILLSSLMAEKGFERVIGKSQSEACIAARKKARQLYHIFQMNSRCTCERTETKKVMCEIYFNYSSKKTSKL